MSTRGGGSGGGGGGGGGGEFLPYNANRVLSPLGGVLFVTFQDCDGILILVFYYEMGSLNREEYVNQLLFFCLPKSDRFEMSDIRSRDENM